jgi:hypothetical protein
MPAQDYLRTIHMEFDLHTAAGTYETVDVDFSTLTYDDLKPFADLGIPDALKAMKNLVGYDYLKSASKTNLDDVRYYLAWLKINDPEKYASFMALDSEQPALEENS